MQVHQDISRRLVVASPAERVRATLLDFHTVASWLSIVGEVRELAPGSRYAAVLEDRVGPFTLRADLEVRVRTEGDRLLVDASGEDRQVASRISAHIEVSWAAGDTGTGVDVGGGYDITGRIATLGAGAIRKKGEKVLDEFCASLARALGSA